MDFIKTTQEVQDGVVTIYTPVGASTILRITHYPLYKEEENGEEKPEFLVIEQNLLVQNVIPVTLKKARLTKRTKDYEYFDIEEAKSAAQPMFTKVDNPDEIKSILSTLENSIWNR